MWSLVFLLGNVERAGESNFSMRLLLLFLPLISCCCFFPYCFFVVQPAPLKLVLFTTSRPMKFRKSILILSFPQVPPALLMHPALLCLAQGKGEKSISLTLSPPRKSFVFHSTLSTLHLLSCPLLFALTVQFPVFQHVWLVRQDPIVCVISLLLFFPPLLLQSKMLFFFSFSVSCGKKRTGFLSRL